MAIKDWHVWPLIVFLIGAVLVWILEVLVALPIASSVIGASASLPDPKYAVFAVAMQTGGLEKWFDDGQRDG